MITKSRFQYYVQSGLLLLLLSCSKPNTNVNNPIVAQVENKVLYQSQLSKIIPKNINDLEDSIRFVNDYINKWIKQQLLVSEAEKNLTNDELNVSQELEDYRQELIIHKFKEKKFEELNVSEVSDSEIEKYYKKNLRLFILEYPIVQVNYVIFPVEIELPATFKHQLVSSNEADLIECEDYIFKFAKKYDDFNNEWIYFQQFKDLGKLNIIDDEKFLRTNNLLEFKDETQLHLIYIKAYLPTGDEAPIEFVKTKISGLIINQKKLDFLREFKDSLYNNALKYNNFRVFNQ